MQKLRTAALVSCFDWETCAAWMRFGTQLRTGYNPCGAHSPSVCYFCVLFEIFGYIFDIFCTHLKLMFEARPAFGAMRGVLGRETAGQIRQNAQGGKRLLHIATV